MILQKSSSLRLCKSSHIILKSGFKQKRLTVLYNLHTDGLSGINDCGLLHKMLVPSIAEYRENRQDETVKSLFYVTIK